MARRRGHGRAQLAVGLAVELGVDRDAADADRRAPMSGSAAKPTWMERSMSEMADGCNNLDPIHLGRIYTCAPWVG
eukprot:113543-Pyramimonas_sp.AAC.1